MSTVLIPAHTKRPFVFTTAFRRIRSAVRPLPKAAMFELAEDGFDSPFEQVVACIISVRTRDEVTLEVARALFAQARTPADVAAMSIQDIDTSIRRSTFHSAKARSIRSIAVRSVKEYGGQLPCDAAALLALPGVGPKCANLVLGIACGQSMIGVDIHVHRVTNRWGVVAERTPERTMAALEKTLPRRYWVEINRLLVPFGKHICTGVRPKCSTCVVLGMCKQVGVTAHR
ncbi:MAG TPA: endonuclease III [Gemmatimonadaceae bacterium]|nr:endonuclease III [Gemmatimonadaceae bacterium]